MVSSVALVIVFNHRFDNNIEKLEAIYKNRFSYIFHLVPFYDGEKENVIPVYESSYYFQGYMTQGFKNYFKEEFLHYFFLADDLILNPEINERNYQQYFNLSGNASFISKVYSLNSIDNSTLDCYPATLRDCYLKFRNKKLKKWNWCRVLEAYNYDAHKNGVEVGKSLPDYEEAEALLKRHGINIATLTYADVFGGPKKPDNSYKTLKKNFSYLIGQEILKKKYNLKYPLAGAYSDIVIVSHTAIKKFIQYSGAFAATELFVELAIPTALLFATDNIVTETVVSKKGLLYWPFSQTRKQLYDAEMQKYSYTVKNLLNNFPKDKLYVHPIKLSKWKMEVS